MTKHISLIAVLALVGGGLHFLGLTPFSKAAPKPTGEASESAGGKRTVAPPTVTVSRVQASPLQESIVVTGTLVPRLEILVAPEVEGLRVVELLADEADSVEKGQVLARLEQETLKVQLAQNDASLARADAAIAQAKSAIVSAEAREVEARNALERGKPLKASGTITDAVLDQRESAARVAAASLRSAKDGLPLAEADKALTTAQRRDITWKLSRTEVKAPAKGVISRRNTKIGGVATASGVVDPMFRIIADGQIELEADVPEVDLARLKVGQKARITTAGAEPVTGEVRLVSPEVDRSTRQGRVRISLGANPSLKIGSFARGWVGSRASNGLAVLGSAVMHGPDGATVLLVDGTRVKSRKIVTGLQMGDLIEVKSGLTEGDLVVAKAGTFLREGDQITPVDLKQSASKVN